VSNAVEHELRERIKDLIDQRSMTDEELTRERVLGEFFISVVVHSDDQITIEKPDFDIGAMADEIVRLRERLAACERDLLAWRVWGDKAASGHPDAPMASLDHEVRAVIGNKYGMYTITGYRSRYDGGRMISESLRAQLRDTIYNEVTKNSFTVEDSVVDLLDEIIRLREVVRLAFFEGAAFNGPGASEWEWEQSESCKAQEGA
jgi:hypothetical protein